MSWMRPQERSAILTPRAAPGFRLVMTRRRSPSPSTGTRPPRCALRCRHPTSFGGTTGTAYRWTSWSRPWTSSFAPWARCYLVCPRSTRCGSYALDLTRDFFHVRDPSGTLEAIAKFRVPFATFEAINKRPSDGRLQTLTRGNRNYWRVRGYDKVHEAISTASPNQRDLARAVAALRPSQLRFELELKIGGLVRQRLRTVGALMRTDMSAFGAGGTSSGASSM